MYAQTRPAIISKVSKAHSGSSALSPLSYTRPAVARCASSSGFKMPTFLGPEFSEAFVCKWGWGRGNEGKDLG